MQLGDGGSITLVPQEKPSTDRLRGKKVNELMSTSTINHFIGTAFNQVDQEFLDSNKSSKS